MLFSKRAASNSLAFLAGWLVGLTAVAVIVLAIGIEDSGDDADSGGGVRLVIGALFLALAVKQWRSRPSDGAEPPMRLDTGGEAVFVAVYVLVASITLIVPVVGCLAARDKMTPVLDSMKVWLMQNNATVMAVLFAVLGAKVLGDGISVLFS